MWSPSKLQWLVICVGLLVVYYADAQGIGPVRKGMEIIILDSAYYYSVPEVTIFAAVATLFIVWMIQLMRK